MSNDDPTKVISAAPPTPPTQPTIETVLERINQLGESLGAEMNQRVDAFEQNLTQQITNLRAEMNERFSQVDGQLAKLNAKVDVLNDELLNLKADQRMHGKRIDELERQAS